MSYILNALKKSEQERSGDASTRSRSTVLPPLEIPAPTPEGRPTWVLATVGGGGAIVAIAVAVWASGPWFGTTTEADGAANNLVTAATALPAPLNDELPVPHEEVARPNPEVVPEAQVAAASPGPPPPQVEEPTAGSRLPAQRTPRPVSGGPETSVPLVALFLDPPVSPPNLTNIAETPENSRSITEVNLIPPPPGAPTGDPKNSGSVDTDASAAEAPRQTRSKTVTVTPNTVDPEAQRQIAAIPPPPVDRASLREAADFYGRGWAFERSGDFPGALDAFSRALDLRPDFADAYFGRAWIRDRLDQLEQATTDYGHAIRIDPKFAAAYGSRGVARFYLDRLAEAEMDFEQSLRLGRGELRRFAVLWRYLSAEHDGRDGAAQLADDTQNIKLDRWPGVIAQYYLGEVDADAILRNARDPDTVVTRERLCVAYFFIGQKHLLDGGAVQARDHFRKALDTGVNEFIQYKAAQRELKRLARLR